MGGKPTMRSTIVAIFSVLAVLTASAALGAEGSGGKAGAFLRVSPGARPAGMGGAFTSIADDVDALHFNPAGLWQVRTIEVSASYSLLSMDRTHYEAGVAIGSSNLGSLGLMVTAFGVDEIERRDEVGEIVGTFDDREMAITLGYGRHVLGPVGLGASFKYVSHSLAGHDASGLGFDVGVHSRLDLDGDVLRTWRTGVSASNLGMSLKWDTESDHEDDVPVTIRYGTSIDIAPWGLSTVLALDGESTLDARTELRAGLELWPHKALAVRTGYDDGDLTFGVGVRAGSVTIDYAYCPDVLDEGAAHRLGVGGEF